MVFIALSFLFKVTINFVQTTTIAASINVRWTTSIFTMFEASEYIGALGTAAVSRPIDCLVSSNSAVVKSIWRTLLSLFIPILVMGIFTIVWGCIAIREKKGMSFFGRRVTLSIISVTYIAYLALTKLGVRVFYCVDVYDSNDDSIDSRARYWAVDTSIKCYEKEHAILIGIAAFILVFVSLSFPLLSAAYLLGKKCNMSKQTLGPLTPWDFFTEHSKKNLRFGRVLLCLEKLACQ